MITISLCMIVKNEEMNLSRCLDSIVHLVDEVIIVDTGSTDRTKEIAARYTNQIFDYPWKDNFADARNYCISHATKEYIYMADADEVIDQANQERFLQLKQLLLPEIDIVQMKYCNQLEFGSVYNYDEEYRPKLFKRVREFQYIDPIHETLQVEPVIYDSEIEIEHKPHESHSDRDFAYFQKAISRGERLSKRILNMYAKELFISGRDSDFIIGKPYFESVLHDAKRSMDEVHDAMLVLLHVARVESSQKDMMRYSLKLMSSMPCSELCYELGEYYFNQQEYEEATIWFYNAVYETECQLSLKYAGKESLQRLAECYKELGDEQQYKEYLRITKEHLR